MTGSHVLIRNGDRPRRVPDREHHRLCALMSAMAHRCRLATCLIARPRDCQQHGALIKCLERNYLVVYWEQRGCGNASAAEAERVSLAQQVDDLRAVLRWVADRTQQNVLLFGISIGATISLLAAAREGARVKAVVANSPDLDTRAGDAAVDAFLHEQVRRGGGRRSRRTLTKLGASPYLQPQSFQRRAVLLADFGSSERGKTFFSVLRETLAAMVRTYGSSARRRRCGT
jgi:pimeloyl-ACP methyl ester carboxylesterase